MKPSAIIYNKTYLGWREVCSTNLHLWSLCLSHACFLIESLLNKNTNLVISVSPILWGSRVCVLGGDTQRMKALLLPLFLPMKQ